MFDPSPIPIYTIGYGDRAIAALIALLQHHQITYVVDVRTAPYSRYKPEFSKTELTTALRQAGLTYVFMGDQVAEQRHPKRKIKFTPFVLGCRLFQRVFKESGLCKERSLCSACIDAQGSFSYTYS